MSKPDILTMKRYTSWFTNFAKTGTPNRGSDYNMPKWEKYRERKGSFLAIDEKDNTKNENDCPFATERMEFWHKIHGSRTEVLRDWSHPFFQSKKEEL